MEIQLYDNTLEVIIGNKKYMVDADSLETHKEIASFMANYQGNRIVDDTFLEDCKHVLDVILGKGTYDTLFTGKDLKPYYVILQLIEAIEEKTKDSMVTDAMIKRQEKAKEELQNMQNIMTSFQKFSEQMEYVESKYGAIHVANKKKTTNKRRSK